MREKAGYSIFICQNCQFEFVYPLPTEDEIEEVYNTGMHQNIGDNVKNEINKLDTTKYHPHRDWYGKMLNKVIAITQKRHLKILEIGSSFGGFVHFANKMGHDAIGTEVSQEVVNASKGVINGKIIYVGNNCYNDFFDDDSFDLIYMEHVLEHLTHPEKILSQMYKLLNSKGILAISIPNQRSWMARLYGIYWDWISPPLHLQYFDIKNLQLLLDNSGLEVQKSWTGEYYFRSIYQFFTLAIFKFRLKQILNKLLNFHFTVEYKFHYLYRYPDSFKEHLQLLPYYLLYPVIKLFSFLGRGNDLTVFARKK